MKVILKFADVAIQPSKVGKISNTKIKRAIGHVSLADFMPVFNEITLESNPRQAKRNQVVLEILESMDTGPELLRFKSKGLLMASTDVEELDRGRFRISMNNSSVEGVLDGGHNTMAFLLFILRDYLPEKEFNSLKDWQSLKKVWGEHFASIMAHVKNYDEIFFSVELLYPADNTSNSKIEFEEALFEISQARNNNAQLTDEAFQNHLGLYDNFKEYLPKKYSDKVVWKPGQTISGPGKSINPRDLVALVWVGLNRLDEEGLLPRKISVTPQNIYRNKGECSDKFGKLMRDDLTTQPTGGMIGQQRHLIHEGIESAIKIACDLPELYDEFYSQFPAAYNKGGNSFGARKVVKMYDPDKVKYLRLQGKDHSNYTSSKPVKPFSGESSDKMIHRYPEAFIIPLVTALHVFMEIVDGKIQWKSTNYKEEILTQFRKIAPEWGLVLEMGEWDPQKIAKNNTAHKYAVTLMSK